MGDQGREKLIIDSDWKAEAQREKERLQESERQAAESGSAKPRFADLLNLFVMQIMATLGGMVGPGGQPVPPDIQAARYFIDLLGLLEEKTRGNITAEEKKLLDQVLLEVRMEFVRMTGTSPASAPAHTSDPSFKP